MVTFVKITQEYGENEVENERKHGIRRGCGARKNYELLSNFICRQLSK